MAEVGKSLAETQGDILKTIAPFSQSETSQTESPEYVINNNVLHKFRIFNPVFTLSAVQTKTLVTADGNNKGIDLDLLEKDVTNPDYIIARSSGKGATSQPQEILETGQFDFYFDNLEILTLPAFNKKTSYSKATTISFDLIEPLSVGGLFQALAVTCANAGNLNFKNAIYVLKIQFKGYLAENDEDPVDLGKYSTRYFPLRITGIDVKADLSGTVYHVKAVVSNEMGFTDIAKLTNSLSVSIPPSKDITLDAAVGDFFNKFNQISL
jgi:hypothetical protein